MRWPTSAGPVTSCVNNAGVSVFGPTDEASYADYDWIMGVNFGGVVNGLVTFIPRIKAHGAGGHIVNVASMAAYLSGPQAGIYTASKFAVRGLTECLRFNLAPYGIGVSLMCPGLTRTNAWDSALQAPGRIRRTRALPRLTAPSSRSSARRSRRAWIRWRWATRPWPGCIENRAVIFTHPEFTEDFDEIYHASLAALPEEPAPEGRLHIERLRRAANRAADAGKIIGLKDLT